MTSQRMTMMYLMLAVLVCYGLGCSGNAGYTRAALGSGSGLAPAAMRQFDRRGEQVTLRLLQYDDLRPCTCATGTPVDGDSAVEEVGATQERTACGCYKIKCDEETTVVIPGKPGELPERAVRMVGVETILLTAAVGFAVDAIKTELEKEAARHIQQYKDRLYADDFWEAPGIPRYAGFELIRSTRSYDGNGNRPHAFKMICVFVPADHDRRIFLIRPVYLRLTSAAAKVSRDGSDRTLTISTNILMDAAFINTKDQFVQESVANTTFEVKGYSLHESKRKTASYDPATDQWGGSLKHQVAGYFRAPPLVASEKAITEGWADDEQGGAFRLLVAITETDDSRMRNTLIKFAEIVGENRDKVIEAVTSSPP